MTEQLHTNGNDDVHLSGVDGIRNMEHLQRVFEQNLGAHRFPHEMSEETIVR